MKRTVIATALIASLAAPAFAQSNALNTAIEVYNSGVDSVSERIKGDVELGTTVSTRSNDALSIAIANYNQSVDTPAELLNAATVTVFPSEPTYGAAIFERLDAE